MENILNKEVTNNSQTDDGDTTNPEVSTFKKDEIAEATLKVVAYKMNVNETIEFELPIGPQEVPKRFNVKVKFKGNKKYEVEFLYTIYDHNDNYGIINSLYKSRNFVYKQSKGMADLLNLSFIKNGEYKFYFDTNYYYKFEVEEFTFVQVVLRIYEMLTPLAVKILHLIEYEDDKYFNDSNTRNADPEVDENLEDSIEDENTIQDSNDED